MPTLSENPRVNIWRDRIERSKKVRKTRIKDIKKYINFYKGMQWGDKKTTLSEKPTVNLIFAHVKTQIPYLYFQNPTWYCRPRGKAKFIPQLKQNAELAQHFLNYYAKENLGITLKRQMRLAILDAYFDFGVIKAGYVADFEANPNYGNFKILGQDESGKPIYDINAETGELLKDDTEEIITNEAFFARRISPFAMLFDTECENYFEDGRYLIQEIVKSVVDIKNSRLYENTRDLKPSFAVKPGYDIEELNEDRRKEIEEDLERITIYEIYDLEHDKLLVTADGHDEFLRDEGMPDGIEDSPFEFLRFNEIPDSMYPLSDISPLKTIQEEYNVGRAMIMTHAKRYGRKYGYTDETFAGKDGPQEFEKLKEGEDGIFFKYQGSMPEPLKDAPLDPAVYDNFAQTRIDFDKVSGSTEQERGFVERRKTAYEASRIARAAGIRKEDRKGLVEDFATGVGTKLLQSMQANLTIEEAIQIIGPEGIQWKDITAEQIAGQFTIGVEIGSAAPAIPEFERQELSNFLIFLGQMPPELVMMYINFEGLVRNIGKYFPLLDSDELINPPEKVEEIKQWLTALKQKTEQKQITE